MTELKVIKISYEDYALLDNIVEPLPDIKSTGIRMKSQVFRTFKNRIRAARRHQLAKIAQEFGESGMAKLHQMHVAMLSCDRSS